MSKSIIAQKVSKIFHIMPYRGDSLRYNLQQALKGKFTKKVPFVALSDINFEVNEGEVFGIIGMNGSGKSTLLKILSKIMVPTQGRVELYGKINTLLEVGTGFHPELTGRENVFLNGSILGLKKDEIKSRFDGIVDFSGVETFLDTPVKYFSSGMFVRLAFAVAVHLDPDILIVDEVLSVGDAAFQKKCIRKMEEEVLQGRTVLFVSHNMEQVQKLCNRVMLLHQGQIKQIGDPEKTIRKYLDDYQKVGDGILEAPNQRRGSGMLRLQSVQIVNATQQSTEILMSGEYFIFRIHYVSQAAHLDLVDFRIFIKSANGQILLTFISSLSLPSAQKIKGAGHVDCILPKLPLNIGMYSLDVEIYQRYELSDMVSNAFSFEVVKGAFYSSGDLPDSSVPVLAHSEWSFS